MELENFYVECQCTSPEHMLRFTYDPDENELYTSMFLTCDLPFHKRVLEAIKYVFNYRPPQYGHFDTTILEAKDALKLGEMWKRMVAHQAMKELE